MCTTHRIMDVTDREVQWMVFDVPCGHRHGSFVAAQDYRTEHGTLCRVILSKDLVLNQEGPTDLRRVPGQVEGYQEVTDCLRPCKEFLDGSQSVSLSRLRGMLEMKERTNR
jgi:hypothetical protein